MFRVVPPRVISRAAGRQLRWSATAKVPAIAATGYWIGRAVSDVPAITATDIVSVEIVIIVDGDIVATPPATPAPTAAPECSHQYAKAEGNRHARRIVPPRRIVNGRIGIVRRTVDYDRIIGKARTQLAGWLAR